ncbi:hypothetical protein HQO38_14460 [Rhodococcus fascians]|jgi:hypothetical protein|uniref:Large secreted protein n=2 Tax=root TaxID=1 RepID=A0A143QLK8_RHOFA|nr:MULTISPECIES: hypothetical protein [Rhodococcus]MDP9635485.1 hypothetical protein [Rhodococcus cercidiphylli]MSX06937.1 hypothetical protein [Actinomycetota bacterium]OZD47855.1 hypothetical protein CH252_19855 [Rhodococcus sp. 06-1477-1B]AMY24053.1 hypothetical protein A3Q41_02759 [Rhodococcus fascians]AMY51955.1 hypothetical protein A3L23_00597 [Rhodococcus fascians D188]
MRFLAAGVMLCLLLAGCSTAAGDDDETTPTTNSTTPIGFVQQPSAPPVPHEVPVGDVGTMFESTPDLIRATTTPFESWSQVSPNTIAVHFVTGTPECYGADATVTETDTAVTIELRTGTRPDAEDKSCIMVAVYATMQITLASPLGHRAILNAA